MKVEIKNQNILAGLEQEAEEKLITPEALLREILKERYSGVKDIPETEVYNIDDIRKNAKNLGNNISEAIYRFEDKYKVKASIMEVDYYTLDGKLKYNIKVEL